LIKEYKFTFREIIGPAATVANPYDRFCMKYIFPSFFIILIAVISISAQSADLKNRQKAANQLIQIERDIGKANIRRDKTYFEMIEAPEFVFTDSGGGMTTKAEDVASLDQPAGEYKLISYDVDDMKVNLYGNAAVVIGRSTTVSRGKDRDVTNRSRFTDVFVKKNGKWKIVAGHSSRIRESQK
jgi:hypothetical protein